MMWTGSLCTLTVLASLVSASVDPSDPCGRQLLFTGNLTVTTQSDIDAITKAGCDQISCNLVIDKKFPGLATFPTISRVDNHIRIGEEGDAITDSPLTGLSFPNLTQGDDLAFFGSSGVTTLDLPLLGYTNSITLVDLPGLRTWTGFESLTRASYVTFRNVGLSKVEWNSTDSRDANLIDLYMANNTNLEIINLANLYDVTGGRVAIHGNGKTKIVARMESVRYFEVTGCAGFIPGEDPYGTGFNDIYNISGAYDDDGYIRIYDNSFTELSFSLLKVLNGSIEIHNNPNLVNISFGALKTVNGFLSLTDNDQLKVIKSGDLENLAYVSQGINFTGAFEEIDVQPDLRVQFAMIISSTANISCRPFEGAFLSGFYGRYACAPNGEPVVLATNGTDSSSSEDDSGDDGDGGGLSRAAILGIGITLPIVGLVFWTCVIWWLIKRHRRHRREFLALQQQVATSSQNSGGAGATTETATQIRDAPLPSKANGHAVEAGNLATLQQVKDVSPLSHQEKTPLVANGVPLQHHVQPQSYIPPQTQRHTPFPQQTNTTSLPHDTFASRASQLDAREHLLAERESQRAAEELNERERSLAQREAQIEAWERERGGG